ncbi:hypothetical protein OAH97_00960 [Octadecabacter sp.]|nr:hypothetical protein [Octadecabacter sp.]
MTGCLTDIVGLALDRPVPPEARALAAALAEERGSTVVSILFYGSCLRNQTTEGVLDFYILVDSYRTYHPTRLGAAANAILPPTVQYRPGDDARAKIAVVSIGSFASRMRPDSNDTTMWARFCQPAALLYVRDAQAKRATVNAIADAVATGAVWAKRFGPDGGTSSELWTALFRNTYGAELRVEDGVGRGNEIYDQAADYFNEMLAPALDHAADKKGPGGWTSMLADDVYRAWARKRTYGKIFNISRLIKAAFTFEQKVEYIQWKVERHTGRPLELTDFQKRHPLIAAPKVLWTLWRQGTIR